MTFSRKYTSVLSFERWYYVSGWLNVLRSENKAPRGRDKGRDRGPETACHVSQHVHCSCK